MPSAAATKAASASRVVSGTSAKACVWGAASGQAYGRPVSGWIP